MNTTALIEQDLCSFSPEVISGHYFKVRMWEKSDKIKTDWCGFLQLILSSKMTFLSNFTHTKKTLLNVSIVPPPLCIFNSRLSLITLKASLRSWWHRYASQVRAVASVPGILVSMAGLVGALGGWIWPIGCSTGSILCSFLATSPSCGVTPAPSLLYVREL